MFHLKTPDKNSKWHNSVSCKFKAFTIKNNCDFTFNFCWLLLWVFFCAASFHINFIAEYSHSSVDVVQDSKQNYATPSFRELHKVQRQVLQPAPAYVTDQTSTSGASASFMKVMPENTYEDSLPSRHSFSAGSQAQSRSKTQVFLPGEKSSRCKYLFVDN